MTENENASDVTSVVYIFMSALIIPSEPTVDWIFMQQKLQTSDWQQTEEILKNAKVTAPSVPR